MTTIKKRINITADADVELALYFSARRDKMPVAAKAVELLRLALELEEDITLSSLARARKAQKTKYVSHTLAWK